MIARAVLLAVALALAACARVPDEEVQGAAAPTAAPAPVKRTSAADDWLDVTRVAHEMADEARTAQERAEAQQALVALAERPWPSAIAAHEAASMRRDLYGRGARFALDRERYDEARALIQKGLALPGRDPFRTQLLLLAVEAARALQDARGVEDALRAAREDLSLR